MPNHSASFMLDILRWPQLLLTVMLLLSSCMLPASTVWVVSRAELNPWALEELQHELERRLGMPMSVTFRKISGDRNLDEIPSGTWLLTEVDDEDPLVLPGLMPLPLVVELRWMLGLWRTPLEEIGETSLPIPNLAAFLAACRRLRSRSPSTFPWFQGLYDPGMLCRLEEALGKSLPRANVRLPGSGGLLATLNLAVEENLLNPLSLEADSALAFEVFEAGDCVMTGMWVLPSMLSAESALRRRLPDLVFQPFPRPTGEPQVPMLSLRLFAPEGVTVAPGSPVSAVGAGAASDARLLPVQVRQDREWERRQYLKLYNRLIRGEY